MKKSLFMIFAAAALVSCSESEVNNPLVDGDVQIALRSNTVDASGVVTRAPFEGTITVDNNLEARVVTGTAANFIGTPYANGIMNFKGSLAANYETAGFTGTAATFPDGTNPVYLYGVYPSTWTVEAGGAANFTFTGLEDVMATEKISTVKQDVVDGVYKVLSFKHLLTRLEVKLSAASAAVSAVGDITSIKLVGDKTSGTTPINNKVSITNNGAAMTTAFSSVSATSLNFYDLSLDADNKKVYSNDVVSAYTLTDDATFVGYSMVAPVNATEANEEEYFLEIATTVGAPKRIPVDLMSAANAKFVGSTAGRSFIVSIYFKSNQQISVNVEVQEWENEGEWTGEVPVD